MTRTEHEHYALERMLEEELGGRRPRELRTRILAAAERRLHASEQDDDPAPPTRPFGWRPRRSASIGAVAGVLVSLTLVTALRWSGRESALPRPVVHGFVASGEFAYVGDDAVELHWPDGDVFELRPSIGDRMCASAERPTRIAIQDLGVLSCAPGTELEVRGMVWREFGGGFTAGAVTVGVITGAVQWFGGGGKPVVANAGQRIELARSEPDAVTFEHELADARQQIARLESQLARRSVPSQPIDPAEPSSEEVFVEPIRVQTGLLLDLDSVNWNVTGEAVAAYLSVGRRMAELMAAGEEIPPELRAERERWDSAVVAEVAHFFEELPGLTGTGKMHYPVLGGNLLAAALTQSGVGLDQEQRVRFSELIRSYSAEDAERRASYDESTFELQKFVDEADMHDRCYRELRDGLRANQEAVLTFGQHASRAGVDPFGAGFNWSKWNRRVDATDRTQLAAGAVESWAQGLRLDKGQAALLKPIVEQWARNFPAEWLDRPADALDQRGRHEIARVRTAAMQQLELMRQIEAGVGLSPAQRDRLRSMNSIIIPFSR